MSNKGSPIYPRHRLHTLEPYYSQHVAAMTEIPGKQEGLHSKSDIAEQLAWRDQKIARLQDEIGCLAYGVVTPNAKLDAITQAAVGALGYLPVNVPGARMAKERIEAVLAGREWTQVDVDTAVWEASASAREAELIRLKEENSKSNAAHEHTSLMLGAKLEELGAEKAAHETTRSRLRQIHDAANCSPTQMEEALTEIGRLSSGFHTWIQDRSEPASEPRAIVVGSTWRHNGPERWGEVRVQSLGGRKVCYDGERVSGCRDEVFFRDSFAHVSDPATSGGGEAGNVCRLDEAGDCVAHAEDDHRCRFS